MIVYLIKDGAGNLIPTDNNSRDYVRDKIPVGQPIRASLKKARNYKHHRKFFALLRLVLENTEKFESQEELLDWLKLKTHWVRTREITTKDGDTMTVYIPRSISFDDMDQDQFEAFYDRAVNKILEEVLTGMSERELDREMGTFL